ncbi:MAG: BF3164 family lipoprotein [Bacteroidales bacterium]
MKNFVLLFVITTLITCCNIKNRENVNEFPEKIKLKGKKIRTDLSKATKIIGLSDSIIVVNSAISNYHYWLLNKDNFSLITQTGKAGKGPRELIGHITGNIDPDNGYIYCASISKLKTFRFDIDSILKNKNYLPKIYTKLPQKFTHASNIHVINDSIILGAGMIDYSFYIVNKHQEIIDKFGKLPQKPENIKAITHRHLYGKTYTYNHKKEMIVLGYHKFDTIKGYSLNGELLFQKAGPDFIENDYQSQYKIASKEAYKKIHHTNNYIFALYSGKPGIEKPSEANSLTDVKVIHPKTIHVFDWEGNPKLKIELDKSIIDFTIDNETDRLIGLSFEDQSFIVYDFSKIRNALENL